MTPDRIVIVGAGLSGLRTAERLRRNGYRGTVTLIGEETRLPYDRPPLSKALLTQQEEPGPVELRAPDKYDELDLDVRSGVAATAIDTERRRLSLSDGTTVSFDRLVVATGSRARVVPAWDHFTNVHVLRSFDDLLALRAALRTSAHVTVVGAGVLGGEIAASARALGLAVTLVESLSQPMVRVLGPELGAAVADLHRQHGVDVRLGVTVDLEGEEGRVHRVSLSDGTTFETDLVVAAVGSAPVIEWLAGSPIRVEDGVLCDETGATNVPGVYAVGDAARMPHPGGGGPIRLEHWTSAGDTAAVVAANLVAEPGEERRLTEVPYFWSDQHGVKIQALGVPSGKDEVVVVSGDPAEHRFLALCSRDGAVTAAVAMAMPAPLARCRALVAAATPLAEAHETHPWERARVIA